MLPLTLATYVLLGAGLLFSVIELGLAAYGVSLFGQSYECVTGYSGYNVETGTCKTPVPGIISFLIFVSLWTMGVTTFFLVFPFLQARKANVSHERLNKWLVPLHIGLLFLTFVFWLAGFADVAAIIGGLNVGGVIAAVEAFGVLNWLIYMALFILSILTAVNVLTHDLPGWQPISRNHGTAATPAAGYNSGVPTYDNAASEGGPHHIINEEPKNDATPEMIA